MKLTRRSELPQLIIIALMFIAAAILWPNAPERMPTHWNLQGEVDGYGGKFMGLLMMPLVALGIYLLMLVLPLVDPGRRNYSSFAEAYNAIRLTIILVFAAMDVAIAFAGFGRPIDVTLVSSLIIAAMFIVFGNLMGKLRPNWFVGVRTPWTLSSKMSWNKTHRLAGWLFMVMGIMIAAAGLARTLSMFIAMLVVNVACLVWIVVYSYVIYREDPHRTTPAGISPSNSDNSLSG